MRLYLAGPMRGHDHWNFPAFAVAAAALRADGHEVFSPAEHDKTVGWSPFDGVEPTPEQLERMFQWDLTAVTAGPRGVNYDRSRMDHQPVDAVVLLPGWTRSAGAKLEALVARSCGLPLYRFDLGHSWHGSEHRHLRRIHPPTLEVKFVGEELEGTLEKEQWS